MIFECPGSQKFRQPQPEIIKCGYCMTEVEIWTDEVKAKCPSCQRIVCRAERQSCLDWCRHARTCAGLGSTCNHTSSPGLSSPGPSSPGLEAGLLKKKKEGATGLYFTVYVVSLNIEEEWSLTLTEAKGGGSSREGLAEVVRKETTYRERPKHPVIREKIER